MILALCGRSGSGKDTVADYISKRYGFIKVAFADALKIHCATQYELPLDYFYDQRLKDTMAPVSSPIPLTPRDIMLKEALSLRAQHGQDVFANIILKKMEDNKRYVISDLRFYNELACIKKAQILYITWYIHRDTPGYNPPLCGLEIKKEDCDIIVNNTTTITDLLQGLPTFP